MPKYCFTYIDRRKHFKRKIEINIVANAYARNHPTPRNGIDVGLEILSFIMLECRQTGSCATFTIEVATEDVSKLHAGLCGLHDSFMSEHAPVVLKAMLSRFGFIIKPDSNKKTIKPEDMPDMVCTDIEGLTAESIGTIHISGQVSPEEAAERTATYEKLATSDIASAEKATEAYVASENARREKILADEQAAFEKAKATITAKGGDPSKLIMDAVVAAQEVKDVVKDVAGVTPSSNDVIENIALIYIHAISATISKASDECVQSAERDPLAVRAITDDLKRLVAKAVLKAINCDTTLDKIAAVAVKYALAADAVAKNAATSEAPKNQP